MSASLAAADPKRRVSCAIYSVSSSILLSPPHAFAFDPPPLSRIPYPASLIPHPSSLIPHPSSLIPHPSSPIPHPAPRIPHLASRLRNPTYPPASRRGVD